MFYVCVACIFCIWTLAKNLGQNTWKLLCILQDPNCQSINKFYLPAIGTAYGTFFSILTAKLWKYAIEKCVQIIDFESGLKLLQTWDQFFRCYWIWSWNWDCHWSVNVNWSEKRTMIIIRQWKKFRFQLLLNWKKFPLKIWIFQKVCCTLSTLDYFHCDNVTLAVVAYAQYFLKSSNFHRKFLSI